MLAGIEINKIQGDTTIEITGIAYDSRKVEEGNVFVCIKGYKTDGHQYIADALKKGASALIVEDAVTGENISGTVIEVSDSRKALSKLSSNYFDNPTDQIKVMGVTGTNGKTTFTYMVHQIFKAAQEPCAVLGTISYQIGDHRYTSTNTTPESYELQKMFKEMLKENIQSCVMEVSSHSLALNRVEDIQFDYGVYTNLTPDHLDFHSGFDDYFNSKKKLFYKTRKANIVNIDDSYGKVLIEDILQLNVKAFTYGIDEPADFQAKKVQISDRSSDFDVWYKKQLLGHLCIPIPGKFSVYNALASAATCFAAGIPFEIIKKGLESIKGVPGRFELVENDKDYLVIVDYAHTPDALEKVLNTINSFKKGRVISVFGCGGDRDRTKRSLMGKAAGQLSDYCIITSDNPRNEDPVQILEDTKKGIIETKCTYEVIEDRYEAIKRAIEIYKKNDTILLAGKGHETYQVIKDKTIHFDDREVSKEIINGMKSGKI